MSTRGKKILNVVPVVERRTGGGVAERGINLSKYLYRRGFSVCTLSLRTKVEKSVFDDLKGTCVTLLPTLNQRFGVPHPSILKLAKLIREADLIHLNNHWSVLNALVFFVNLIFRRPVIVCPAGSLVETSKSRWIKRIFDLFVGRYIIRTAKARVAVTEREVGEFSKYGVEPGDVTVIPNGIALSLSVPLYAPRIERPYILFLGRLNNIKGVDLLVDAYLEIIGESPFDYDLVVAGRDEGELDALQEKVTQAGVVDRVHFPGFLTGVDKASYLRNASVMVIPSRSEAMSIVVLEAGIHAVPVICTDKCGLEYFSSQGLLSVTSATSQGIRTELLRFARNRQRAEQGLALSRVVKEEFSWDKVSLRYAELIARCL